MAIIGVVASGNLEVLAERVLPDTRMPGRDQDRSRGLRRGVGVPSSPTSSSAIRPAGSSSPINDGGARPDTVSLRLAQAVRLMEEDDR